jgi:[ribosomal protein S5]-alanine N-acetyltransferase
VHVGRLVEAIVGRAAWAFTTGRARVCVASVSPGNAPSLALVHSLGFRQVGEQIDEIDGLELVFECPLPLLWHRPP